MIKRLYALLLAAALLVVPFAQNAAALGDGTEPAAMGANTGTKLIAFTFDDGPSAYTAGLLDGLKARGAHATFFMTGVNGGSGIVNRASVLTRMRDEGHQLANHTYSHIVPFNTQSASTISSQVSRVEQLLFQYMGGSYTDMVRTPGGALGTNVQNNVPAPIINWSVDTLDWKYRNADTVYNNIISGAQDGAIVLLHDLYPTSIQGALRAIDTLQAQGYECVTVAELLRRRGITPVSGRAYYSAPPAGVNLPAYSAPVISSSTGTDGVQVTFSSGNTGVPLYYTTNGSTPHLGSARYTGPITITQDTTFAVCGIDQYGTRTPVTVQKVAGMPRAAAPAVSYENGLLTLTTDTPGAQIYYTTDGSQPTAASTLYTGGFAPGTTTKCIAVRDGYLDSPVLTCTLTAYGRLFTDVAAEAWYYDAVGEVVERGLMNGTGDYTFSPDTVLTRAMAATVLHSMAGQPEAGKTTPFIDVAADQWYADAVQWAAANGIMTGYAGAFRPDQPITREQLAAILYRYAQQQGYDTTAGADLSGFADASEISDYAVAAMQWANAEGLINGMTDSALAPQGSATRAQMAAILQRYAARLQAEG